MLEFISAYIVKYLIIGLIFVLINCFVSGYNDEKITSRDIADIILWPISVMILFGTVSKLLVIYYQTKMKNKPKKKKVSKPQKPSTSGPSSTSSNPSER